MTTADFTPSEHESQVAFFEWWELAAAGLGVDPRLCFAVPNGGHRHPAVAGKLKAEGVKSGVSDVFLLTPRGGFHGLIIEFKRGGPKKGQPSVDQEAFLFAVRREGYNAVIAYSTEEAMRIVRAYLKGSKQ